MSTFRSRLARLKTDLGAVLPCPPFRFILTREEEEIHRAWFAALTAAEQEAVRASPHPLVVNFLAPDQPQPC